MAMAPLLTPEFSKQLAST